MRSPFVSTKLEDVVLRAGADYAIFWEPIDGADDDAKGDLRTARYFSFDGQLMRHSCARPQGADACAVGRAWALKEDVLVRDAMSSDVAHFRRVQLAFYHGIRSIAFLRYANGVLELGTTSPVLWTAPPNVDALPRASARLSLTASVGGRSSFGGAVTPRPPPSAGGAPTRFDLSAGDVGVRAAVHAACAHYGVFWAYYEVMNELKAESWYAPDGKCMQRSCTFSFRPGYGAVGRAWGMGRAELAPDAQALPAAEFLRLQLATFFGIRSIAFLPYAQGVLEVGTTGVWAQVPAIGAAGAEGAPPAARPDRASLALPGKAPQAARDGDTSAASEAPSSRASSASERSEAHLSGVVGSGVVGSGRGATAVDDERRIAALDGRAGDEEPLFSRAR
ncbi:hypothetical protein KFE25_004617 [Diacronema lutheri]|uniref:Uncharacterized protein n=2 Tax=Diacronema lutheri TaxID=2081491 RepID=A0A8J5X771_DIALT|nr:hypothetical protein KFE25_004617 [Diacronema lutheri]